MKELKICPICGGEMINPVGVYVRVEHPEHGPTLYTITARGCDVSSVKCEAERPRGVVIIQEYLGECGHRWIETEQFHKGSTIQDWQQLNTLVGPDYVIWRD